LRGSLSYSRASSRDGAFAHRGLTGSGDFSADFDNLIFISIPSNFVIPSPAAP